MSPQPDVRQDLINDEQFDYNCAHYADWAFYTPPEQFLFHHYDEPADKQLICYRPMAGLEKYVVEGVDGGFYGVYDTRTVIKYLKTGTWVELPSELFFAEAELIQARKALAEKLALVERLKS